MVETNVGDAGPGRFVDNGTTLQAFADHVLVTCPRCRSHGAIDGDPDMRSRRGRFRCTGCLLDLDTSRRDWMGPVVRYGKRPCGYCGHMWVTHRSFHHAPVVGRGDMSLCRCPSCGRDNEIPTTQSPAPRGNHALDPYFGMPLLLQVEMPDGVLWAYNGSHLDALRGYVSAKLRERRGPLKSTMFARLPPWISSAKHREKVLKGIGRLAHLL